MVIMRDFVQPVVALAFWMGLSIVSLNQLCQLHQIYQGTSARLQSEQWLLRQCGDPHFFSNMHLHTDLCFTVENNARIGAFMLALREFTQGIIGSRSELRVWLIDRLVSWPAVLCVLFLVLFAPSWLVLGCRSLHPSKRWAECRDRHLKDA